MPADVFVVFGITGDLANPPSVQPYQKRSWGPEAAEQLVDGYGGRREPWTTS